MIKRVTYFIKTVLKAGKTLNKMSVWDRNCFNYLGLKYNVPGTSLALVFGQFSKLKALCAMIVNTKAK